MDENADQPGESFLALTGKVVAAYVGNNSVAGSDLSQLIRSVHSTLSELSSGKEGASNNLKPAVPIKRSIMPDYIVCLEDGRKLKMLKRYLRSRYKLTPDEYRRKWGLPADYPMVAANYSERRSAFAKKIGLGRLPKSASKRRRG